MKALNTVILSLFLVSCGAKKKDPENPSVLSAESCEKLQVYCYTPKDGFGFDTDFCLKDSGIIVKVCALDYVKKCETESMTIRLYGDDFKNVDCSDVGLPL